MKYTQTRQICLLLIITLILFHLAGCSVNEVSSIKIEKTNISNLVRTIEAHKNNDYGYGFLAEELKDQKCLYTTFYVFEIFKYLNIDNDELIDVTQDVEKCSLDELYYLSSIHHQFIVNSNSIKKQIEKRLFDFQNEYGMFVFDENDIDGVLEDDYYDPSNYLSIYMGLNIVKMFDYHYSDTKLFTWLEKNFDRVFTESDSNIIQINNISILYNISNLLGFNIEKYRDRIIELTKLYSSNIETSLLNMEEFYLPYIDNYLNLSNNFIESKVVDEKIIEYILTLQKESGGFGMTRTDVSNILPTYLAVRFLSCKGYTIPNLDSLFKYIQRYKLSSGYYIKMFSINSDATNTFYVYKILDELNENPNNEFREYLIKNRNILEQNNIIGKLYYIKLCTELDETDMFSKNEVVKEILNYLSGIDDITPLTTKKNTISCLQILKCLGIDSKEIQNHISILIKNQSTDVYNKLDKLLLLSLDIEILSSISDYQLSINNINDYKKKLNSIRSIDNPNQLYYIYEILKCCEIMKINACADIECPIADGIA